MPTVKEALNETNAHNATLESCTCGINVKEGKCRHQRFLAAYARHLRYITQDVQLHNNKTTKKGFWTWIYN